MNKYVVLIICLIIGVWVVWYSVYIENTEEETITKKTAYQEKENIEEQKTEEELRQELREKSDYVLDDTRNGEIYVDITNTENCNNYRSEEYGFQLNFPAREDGNNCKIIKKTNFSDWWSKFVYFQFLLEQDPGAGYWLTSNPILDNSELFTLDRDSEYYGESIIPEYGWYWSFILTIMDEDWFNDPEWDNDLIYTRKWMEEHIIWRGNKYYIKGDIDPEYSYYKLWYGVSDGETWYNYIKDHIDIFDI